MPACRNRGRRPACLPPLNRGLTPPARQDRKPPDAVLPANPDPRVLPSTAPAPADRVPLRERHPADPRRYGCNSSGCHGKAEGQGGFKLSVFASDPEADYAALTKEGRGRRVFPAKPEESLLLRKATGPRRPRRRHEAPLRRRRLPRAPRLDRRRDAARLAGRAASRVAPRRAGRARHGPKAEQQLKVFAKYSDGTEKDVTRHARFQSNAEAVAAVSAGGLVTTRDVPGEAAVMAAYLGEVGMFRVMVPRPGEPRARTRCRNSTSSTSSWMRSSPS